MIVRIMTMMACSCKHEAYCRYLNLKKKMSRNKPIPSEQYSQIYNRKFCRVIKYPASFEPTPCYQVPRATLHDKPQTKAARIAFYQFQNGPLDC